MKSKYVLLLMVLIPAVLCANEAKDPIDSATKIIESMEWDVHVLSKAHRISDYSGIYKESIRGGDPKSVVPSLIALGIVKDRSARAAVKQLKGGHELDAAKSFYFCRIEVNCEEHIAALKEQGRKTQKVAGANSLANLRAIELLSLLPVKDFAEYVDTLDTDESFQRGALKVALRRYRSIYENDKSIND